jgi:hypothetical protein
VRTDASFEDRQPFAICSELQRRCFGNLQPVLWVHSFGSSTENLALGRPR